MSSLGGILVLLYSLHAIVLICFYLAIFDIDGPMIFSKYFKSDRRKARAELLLPIIWLLMPIFFPIIVIIGTFMIARYLLRRFVDTWRIAFPRKR